MGSGGIQQFLQQMQQGGGMPQLGNLGSNIPQPSSNMGGFGGSGMFGGSSGGMPGSPGSTIPQEPLQGPQGIRSPGGLNGTGPNFSNNTLAKPPMQGGNSKGGPSMSGSILPGMQQMQPMQAGGAMAQPMKPPPWMATSGRGPGGF
jgi:hypothetical protein